MKSEEKFYSIVLVSIATLLFLIFSSYIASAANVINLSSTNYACYSWSNDKYPLINLFGEDYVPLLANGKPIWQSHVNKFTKLVIDSDNKITLRTGEKVDLGQGYTLEAKQVDVDGKKVWLEFDKDGQFVDDQIVSTDTGNHTWTCEVDGVQGEDNVLVLKVHVNQVFQGAVDSIAQIDGIWLIDYANAMTLEVGDKFGEITLTQIINGVDEYNLGSLVFDVLTPSIITVISPKDGDNWQAGTDQEIKWEYNGNLGQLVKIELLQGEGLSSIINDSIKIGENGTGSFKWSISLTQIPGDDYKVKISSITNSEYNNSSIGNLTISSPPTTITVISPKDGDNWKAGMNHSITWKYTGNPGSLVKIELLKGGVYNRTIKYSYEMGEKGNGSYNWPILPTQKTGNDYKVKISSITNPEYNNSSTGNFTISFPSSFFNFSTIFGYNFNNLKGNKTRC